MDYDLGLETLRRLTEGTEWYKDFVVHEAALRDNLDAEHRYGPSEQSRRDRARIVDQLNLLALAKVSVSFNDLCLGKVAQPTQAENELTVGYRTKLRQNLTRYFGDSDLHDLCFDMDIDYESLPGQSKKDKARELVTYCEHHSRISELVAMCSKLRPAVVWEDRTV